MYDVIIIGAGPAGLTAALYCGRARLHTKLIDKASAGGQLNLTYEIENYPGVPKVSPSQLVESMLNQVKTLEDVEFEEFKEIVEVKNSDIIEVVVKSGGDENISYKSKSLIIASGANPKKLGLPGEERLTGRGVSYCAVCDGPFFKNKDLVLLGGGDTAIEEAIYLTKFASTVTVIHRRDQLRATKILQDRLKSNPKIRLVLDSVAEEILGDSRVEKIRIKNLKTDKLEDIICSGVFIFVGYSPNTCFLNNLLELDQDKYIITDEKMSTKQKGIFACGDCRKRPFRQVITACGEGAVAAHSVEQYLC